MNNTIDDKARCVRPVWVDLLFASWLVSWQVMVNWHGVLFVAWGTYQDWLVQIMRGVMASRPGVCVSILLAYWCAFGLFVCPWLRWRFGGEEMHGKAGHETTR